MKLQKLRIRSLENKLDHINRAILPRIKEDIQTLLSVQVRPGDNSPELMGKLKKIAKRHS
jgi:hypothetical protein